MARTIFGTGSQGELIRNVQQALTTAGFDTKGLDGVYGSGVTKALNSYQIGKALPSTGVLDDGSWSHLMAAPIPSVLRRGLQVTASFEGQGFELAVGNFDGALLTWGIIGFTLLHGEIQKIVLGVHQADNTLVPQAFGDKAAELLQLMQAPVPVQKSWAQANTAMPSGRLSEPWKSMFATFGSFPAVQQAQLDRVQHDYMVQAVQTATSLGLRSELGLALCFDIHVQDGGINSSALAKIRAERTSTMGEAQLLPIIAHAVASTANPKYADDVLARKLTIATGHGTVHGRSYILDNWGLRVDVHSDELTTGAAESGAQTVGSPAIVAVAH